MDLTVAQQAVQSAHAAIDFIFQHPSRASPWHTDSNYLVLLGAKDENHLVELINKCESNLLDHTIFREPDLNNTITSIAIEPSSLTQKLFKKMPLLLSTSK